MIINKFYPLTHNHKTDSIKVLGFWIFMMSDCIIFCCLFAVYAVLVSNTAGGPVGRDIFNLPFVLTETNILLLSSITCNFANCSNNKNKVTTWLILTWIFGIIFVDMEMYEFCHLIRAGFTPSLSGFLSAFFAIICAHSLHIISGLIWIVVLIYQIFLHGLTNSNYTRVVCLSLFWRFLDIIWICIFSVVYLIGVL